MMYPQLLLISQNSRTRRLYHHLLEKVDCELHTASSIAEALIVLVSIHPDIVLLDSEISAFELHTFVSLLEKKPSWTTIPLVVFGTGYVQHMFPARTKFADTNDEIVSILIDLCATM